MTYMVELVFDRREPSEVGAIENSWQAIAETESVWDAGLWDGITVMEPQYSVYGSVPVWDAALWDEDLNPVVPYRDWVIHFAPGIHETTDLRPYFDAVHSAGASFNYERLSISARHIVHQMSNLTWEDVKNLTCDDLAELNWCGISEDRLYNPMSNWRTGLWLGNIVKREPRISSLDWSLGEFRQLACAVRNPEAVIFNWATGQWSVSFDKRVSLNTANSWQTGQWLCCVVTNEYEPESALFSAWSDWGEWTRKFVPERCPFEVMVVTNMHEYEQLTWDCNLTWGDIGDLTWDAVAEDLAILA